MYRMTLEKSAPFLGITLDWHEVCPRRRTKEHERAVPSGYLRVLSYFFVDKHYENPDHRGVRHDRPRSRQRARTEARVATAGPRPSVRGDHFVPGGGRANAPFKTDWPFIVAESWTRRRCARQSRASMRWCTWPHRHRPARVRRRDDEDQCRRHVHHAGCLPPGRRQALHLRVERQRVRHHLSAPERQTAGLHQHAADGLPPRCPRTPTA